MNPLVLALLVGGGLYLYNQSQSKPKVGGLLGSDPTNPNTNLFVNRYGGNNWSLGQTVIFKNGKLIKGEKANEIINNAAKSSWNINTNPESQGFSLHKFFDDAINYGNDTIFLIKRDKNLKFGQPNPKINEAIKWLYNQNYQLINEIFYDYVKAMVSLLQQSNKPNLNWDLILQNTFDKYFTILKAAGVPEDKWPGQNIEI